MVIDMILHLRKSFASTLTLRRPFQGVVIHKSTSEELVPRSLTEDLLRVSVSFLRAFFFFRASLLPKDIGFDIMVWPFVV
jgi:hypothetical protein